MVDIVVNHMGYYCGKAEDGHCGPQGTIDYSIYNPFNSEKYFHPFCEINYNNATSILVVRQKAICINTTSEAYRCSVGKVTRSYRYRICAPRIPLCNPVRDLHQIH